MRQTMLLLATLLVAFLARPSTAAAQCERRQEAVEQCERAATRRAEDCSDNCSLQQGACQRAARGRPNAYERCEGAADQCGERCDAARSRQCQRAVEALDECNEPAADVERRRVDAARVNAARAADAARVNSARGRIAATLVHVPRSLDPSAARAGHKSSGDCLAQ